MSIKKSRIQKIDPYTRLIPPGDDLVIGIVNPPAEKLRRIGFSSNLEHGESILPAPVGPTTLFNAEGKSVKRKDLPMETAYRTAEWSWTEWHGPDRIEKTEFRDVPYSRYPRDFIAPPSIELTLVTDADGNPVVRTPLIKNWRNQKEVTVHGVNLMLELFGECGFYDGSMKKLIEAPIKRLNWRILPPGQRPFSKLKTELEDVLKEVKDGKRAFTEHRLETINDYRPEFTVVGSGGFRGYVIFGFPKKEVYVLESVLYGNATYLFDKDWEELSKKTKAEILSQGLQKGRLVHHRFWAKDITGILT